MSIPHPQCDLGNPQHCSKHRNHASLSQPSLQAYMSRHSILIALSVQCRQDLTTLYRHATNTLMQAFSWLYHYFSVSYSRVSWLRNFSGHIPLQTFPLAGTVTTSLLRPLLSSHSPLHWADSSSATQPEHPSCCQWHRVSSDNNHLLTWVVHVFAVGTHIGSFQVFLFSCSYSRRAPRKASANPLFASVSSVGICWDHSPSALFWFSSFSLTLPSCWLLSYAQYQWSGTED